MNVFKVENNEPEPFDTVAALDAKIAVCHEQLADLDDAEKKLAGHKVLRWFEVFKDYIAAIEAKLHDAKKGLLLIDGMSEEEIERNLEMVLDKTSASYRGNSGNAFRVLQLRFASARLQAEPRKRRKLNI